VSILIVTPLVLSLIAAAMRATTGVSIQLAFMISGLVLVGLVIISGSVWSYPAWRSNTASLRALAVTAASLAPLVTAPYSGLVNFGTADGGNHIRFYQSFITAVPDAYNGFVGFYGLLFLIRWVFGIPVDEALLVALAYTTFVLTWVVSLWSIRRGVPLLWVLVLNTAAVVPIAMVLQGNGFYPQLLGLVIFSSYLLVCDRLLDLRAVFPITLLGAAALRYSYGLTIGDILFAGGGWLLIHRRYLLALALLGLGAYAVVQLAPIMTLSGAFPPLAPLPLGIAAALLLISVRGRVNLSSAVIVSSFVIWLGFGIQFGFDRYYVQKYAVGLCLTIAAVAIQSLRGAPAARMLALGGVLIATGFAIYPYTHKAIRVVRGKVVHPEVDNRLIREMRHILAENKAPLSVFIGSRWPRTNSVNAVFNYEYPYQDYIAGTIPNRPGCIFFDATDGLVPRLRANRMAGLASTLEGLARAAHTRFEYPAPWTTQGTRSIGVVCK
jgi:hypothetical protein